MCCKDKPHNDNCSLDLGRGCMFCNCQTEPNVTICEGCFKLHETDWLAEMPDMYESDIFEVRFKNTRRSYYRNVNGLDLKKGDIVAVESSPGHDIGIISLTGDMVAKQMKRVGFSPINGEFRKIYRKAKPYDIEKWQEAIAMEHETMIRSRQIAAEMGLNMKIGDVEYQGDKIKAIFYYIADERVDFRELIKVFAEQFRIRVEMKQIGARQEAGRIGGLGSCGRELCCASWISSFVSVTTNSARAQEISLNPQKLAGQCSKLKCCLVYELDDYLDARREFPRIYQPLQALDGEYHLVKTDILGRTMSFSTSPNAMIGVVTLPISRVKEIIDINRRGQKVDKLEDEQQPIRKAEEPSFVDIIGEDITRFDSSQSEGRRPKRSGRGRSRGTEKRNGGEKQPENGRSEERRSRDQSPAAQRTAKPQGGRNNRTDGNGSKRDQAGHQGPKPPRSENGGNTGGQRSEQQGIKPPRSENGGNTGGPRGDQQGQRGDQPHNRNNRNRNRQRKPGGKPPGQNNPQGQNQE